MSPIQYYKYLRLFEYFQITYTSGSQTVVRERWYAACRTVVERKINKHVMLIVFKMDYNILYIIIIIYNVH